MNSLTTWVSWFQYNPNLKINFPDMDFQGYMQSIPKDTIHKPMCCHSQLFVGHTWQ